MALDDLAAENGNCFKGGEVATFYTSSYGLKRRPFRQGNEGKVVRCLELTTG